MIDLESIHSELILELDDLERARVIISRIRPGVNLEASEPDLCRALQSIGAAIALRQRKIVECEHAIQGAKHGN